MLVDIIVLVLLLVALFKGLRKGLVVALFSFLAFVIGLAAALKLSTAMAAYLGANISISQRWLPVIAFIAVFLIVVLLVRLGAKALETALRLVLLGWLNRIGGVLFFALLYLFIFSILLFYADGLHLVRPETKDASQTYGYLQPLAPKIIAGLGSVLPFFRNMFDELSSFFGHVGSSPH
ncbi:MAG: colicin production protein [Flaviaesturariibacter sp.]|nr:colicin production protein [Flaviaesturariibacter sp.]